MTGTNSGYVLIVDDDIDARMLLFLIVRSLKLDAEMAEDGVQALAKIREKIPALVLLDLMMPHLDGFGVLKEMNSRFETRRIPVVVVSAVGRDQAVLLRLPGVLQVVRKGELGTQEMATIIATILKISPVTSTVSV